MSQNMRLFAEEEQGLEGRAPKPSNLKLKPRNHSDDSVDAPIMEVLFSDVVGIVDRFGSFAEVQEKLAKLGIIIPDKIGNDVEDESAWRIAVINFLFETVAIRHSIARLLANDEKREILIPEVAIDPAEALAEREQIDKLKDDEFMIRVNQALDNTVSFINCLVDDGIFKTTEEGAAEDAEAKKPHLSYIEAAEQWMKDNSVKHPTWWDTIRGSRAVAFKGYLKSIMLDKGKLVFGEVEIKGEKRESVVKNTEKARWKRLVENQISQFMIDELQEDGTTLQIFNKPAATVWMVAHNIVVPEKWNNPRTKPETQFANRLYYLIQRGDIVIAKDERNRNVLEAT